MAKLERMAERSADRKQSPYYVAWDERPENKARAATQQRREMRAKGASFIDLLATYKPNPVRVAWLKKLRRLEQAEESAETDQAVAS